MISGRQLCTIATPRNANAGAAISSGWTLSQMYPAGSCLAVQHANGHVATVSIDAMRFLRPIKVGDEVNCPAVKIETWTRGRTRGHR